MERPLAHSEPHEELLWMVVLEGMIIDWGYETQEAAEVKVKQINEGKPLAK